MSCFFVLSSALLFLSYLFVTLIFRSSFLFSPQPHFSTSVTFNLFLPFILKILKTYESFTYLLNIPLISSCARAIPFTPVNIIRNKIAECKVQRENSPACPLVLLYPSLSLSLSLSGDSAPFLLGIFLVGTHTLTHTHDRVSTRS